MNNEKKTEEITLLREEIVKKINALVAEKTTVAKVESTPNKTIINSLRYKMSSLAERNHVGELDPLT